MAAQGLILTLPPSASGRGETFRKKALWLLSACACVCLLLLILLPGPRNGFLTLCNELLARSESVNRYAYTYFETAPSGSTTAALWLLGALSLLLLLFLLLCRSRVPALITAVCAAGFQAWIGLSLPFAANVALFTFLGLTMLRPCSGRTLAACLAVVLLLSACVFLFRPQTDPSVEQASESVRDFLSRAAETFGGAAPTETEPEPLRETRHVNPQSLSSGALTAASDQEYRLVVVGEEQIARPRWVQILRIIGLLLLAVLVVVLPILPFVALSRRRQKTRAARQLFQAENPAVAASAIFLHVIRYLDCSGLGEGNRLFRLWGRAENASSAFPLWQDFHACSLIYEQAAYSAHPPTPEQLDLLRNLLRETETLLFDQADWKQKCRLRYRECLHE